MKTWGKAVGFGVLMWLAPFVVAVLIFSIHETNRPLFESIMAVTVCAAAVWLGIRYLKKVNADFVKVGIQIGLLWLIISVLIDAPLMLLGGPMKMSIAAYLADIGVTYLCIPLITGGLGIAFSRSTAA